MERKDNKESINLTSQYFRPAVGAILLYDSSDLETLNKLTKYIDSIGKYCSKWKELNLMVLGLWGNRKESCKAPVDPQSRDSFVERFESSYPTILCAELNALTGENAYDSFVELTRAIHSKVRAHSPLTYSHTIPPSGSRITLTSEHTVGEEQRSSCCIVRALFS